MSRVEEAERSRSKTSNNNIEPEQRGQAGAKACQGIWNIDIGEWGQCGIFIPAHTHTQQMGPQGLKRGYSSPLRPSESPQIHTESREEEITEWFGWLEFPQQWQSKNKWINWHSKTAVICVLIDGYDIGLWDKWCHKWDVVLHIVFIKSLNSECLISKLFEKIYKKNYLGCRRTRDSHFSWVLHLKKQWLFLF